MKKKILFLTTVYDIGGAEKALLKILPRIKNFEVAIAALKFRGPLGKKFEALDIPTYYLEQNTKKDILSAVFRFRRVIKKEKPDILVTFLPHAAIFGRIFGRLFGIRKIADYLRSRLRGKKYVSYFILDSLTSFLVTKYIALSKPTKEFYTKKLFVSPRKIKVIPNGIELEKFNKPQNISEIKNSLGLGKRDVIIGTVSRLSPEKGIQYLIRAMPEVIKKEPRAKLIIAGDGGYRQKLEKLIMDLKLKDGIQILGFRDDITKILQVMDIFSMPSIYEGMPNAVLEAMAAKRAIAVSDIPENRELIDDGVSGLLVLPKNPTALASKITELIKNPRLREKLSKAAYEKARNFDIRKTVEKLENLLTRIVGSDPTIDSRV